MIFKLRQHILLAWNILRSSRSPWTAKLAIVMALIYVISPLDLVPDFFPIVGWIDDGLVFFLLMQLAMRLLPESLAHELGARMRARHAHTAPRD